MKRIYFKKCECGNTIEILAERIGATVNYRIIGASLDIHYRAMCMCWKVYDARRAMNRFSTMSRNK